MKRVAEYILRMDQYPLVHSGKAWEKLPLEVHLTKYAHLDEAFFRLFSTPVSLFDEQIAATHDKRMFIKNAAIYEKENLSPIATLVLDSSGPQSSVLLVMDNMQKRLTPGIIEMFKVAGIPIGSDHLLLAKYDRSRANLLDNHLAAKDVLAAIRAQTKVDAILNPFRVETRSNLYNELVPQGTTNGVTVVESSIYDDYRQAFHALLSVQMEALDPKFAFNQGLNRAMTSAILRDNTNNNMAELLSVPYDNLYAEYPSSGIYLRFDNRLVEYMTTLVIPEIAMLSIQTGKPQYIAGFDDKRTCIIHTNNFLAFSDQLAKEAKTLSRPRSVRPVRDDTHHPGKKP